MDNTKENKYALLNNASNSTTTNNPFPSRNLINKNYPFENHSINNTGSMVNQKVDYLNPFKSNQNYPHLDDVMNQNNNIKQMNQTKPNNPVNFIPIENNSFQNQQLSNQNILVNSNNNQNMNNANQNFIMNNNKPMNEMHKINNNPQIEMNAINKYNNFNGNLYNVPNNNYNMNSINHPISNENNQFYQNPTLNTIENQNIPTFNNSHFAANQIPTTQAQEEDNDGKHICWIVALTILFGFFAGFYFCSNFKKIKRKELAVAVFLSTCCIMTLSHVIYFYAVISSGEKWN